MTVLTYDHSSNTAKIITHEYEEFIQYAEIERITVHEYIITGVVEGCRTRAMVNADVFIEYAIDSKEGKE